MNKETIWIGNDHGGFELKQHILKYLERGDSIQGCRLQLYRDCQISVLCISGSRSCFRARLHGES